MQKRLTNVLFLVNNPCAICFKSRVILDCLLNNNLCLLEKPTFFLSWVRFLFIDSLFVDIETSIDRARFVRKENPTQAIELYREILDRPNDNDMIIKEKEECTVELAELFGELKDINSLSLLLESSGTFFNFVSKAKAAKLGKTNLIRN